MSCRLNWITMLRVIEANSNTSTADSLKGTGIIKINESQRELESTIGSISLE